MTEAEHESELKLTKVAPYLSITSVHCEDLVENWLRYKGSALYVTRCMTQFAVDTYVYYWAFICL